MPSLQYGLDVNVKFSSYVLPPRAIASLKWVQDCGFRVHPEPSCIWPAERPPRAWLVGGPPGCNSHQSHRWDRSARWLQLFLRPQELCPTICLLSGWLECGKLKNSKELRATRFLFNFCSASAIYCWRKMGRGSANFGSNCWFLNNSQFFSCIFAVSIFWDHIRPWLGPRSSPGTPMGWLPSNLFQSLSWTAPGDKWRRG